MISRLTAAVAALAVAAAASIAFAADARLPHLAALGAPTATDAPAEVVVLPMVVVTGRRSH